MGDWIDKSIDAGDSFGSMLDAANERHRANEMTYDLHRENTFMRDRLERYKLFEQRASETMMSLRETIDDLNEEVSRLQKNVNYYKDIAEDWATHALSGFLSDGLSSVYQVSLGYAHPSMWNDDALPFEKNEVAQKISQAINYARESSVLREALNEWIERHKDSMALLEVPDGSVSQQVEALGERYGIFKALSGWLEQNPDKGFETPVEALSEALKDPEFSRHVKAVKVSFPVPVFEADERRFTMWKDGDSVRFGLLPEGQTPRSEDIASIDEDITDLVKAVGLDIDKKGYLHGDGATPARLAALMESVSLRFSRKLENYYHNIREKVKKAPKALGFEDLSDVLKEEIGEKEVEALVDKTGAISPEMNDRIIENVVHMRDGIVNWFEQSAIRAWQTLLPDAMTNMQKETMFNPEIRTFFDQDISLDKDVVYEFLHKKIGNPENKAYYREGKWLRKNSPALFRQYVGRGIMHSRKTEKTLFFSKETYEIDKDILYDALLFISALSGSGQGAMTTFMHSYIKNHEGVFGSNGNDKRFSEKMLIDQVHSILNMPPMSADAAFEQARMLTRAADEQVTGMFKPSNALEKGVKYDAYRNSSEQTRIETWVKAYTKATFLKGYGTFMSLTSSRNSAGDPKAHMLALMAGLKAANNFYHKYANDIISMVEEAKKLLGGKVEEDVIMNRLIINGESSMALKIARERQAMEIIGETQKILNKNGVTVGVKPAWVMDKTIDRWEENTISLNEDVKKAIESDVEHLTMGDKPVELLGAELTNHVRPVLSDGVTLTENTMRKQVAASLEEAWQSVNDEIDELKNGDNVIKAYRQSPLLLYAATMGEQYPKAFLRNLRAKVEKDAFYEKALLMVDKHGDMSLIEQLRAVYMEAFSVKAPDDAGVKETLDALIERMEEKVDLSDAQKMKAFSRFTVFATELQTKLDGLQDDEQAHRVQLEVDAQRTQAPKPDMSLVKKLFSDTSDKIILGETVGSVDHFAIFDMDNAYGLYQNQVKPFVEGKVVPASTLSSLKSSFIGPTMTSINHESVAIYLEPHSAYNVMVLGKQINPHVDAFFHGDAREGIQKILEEQPDFKSKYLAVGRLAALTAIKMSDAAWLNHREKQIEEDGNIDEAQKAKLLGLISRIRKEAKLEDRHFEDLHERLSLLKEMFDKVVEETPPEERKGITNFFGVWDVNQLNFISMVSLIGGAGIATSSKEVADHMLATEEDLVNAVLMKNGLNFESRFYETLPFGYDLAKGYKNFYGEFEKIGGYYRVFNTIREKNQHDRRMMMFAWVVSQINDGTLKNMDAVDYMNALEQGDGATYDKALKTLENIQHHIEMEEKLLKQENLAKMVKD